MLPSNNYFSASPSSNYLLPTVSSTRTRLLERESVDGSDLPTRTVSRTDSNAQYFHPNLRQFNDSPNDDVEMQPTSVLHTRSCPYERVSTSMQAPPPRYLVIDTNVLLDHLEVLKDFVLRVKVGSLPPVTVVIPGIVIHELDKQKNKDRLAKPARRASRWILAEISEKGKRIVTGQADRETCMPSGDWKREIGQSNDEFILDCCRYYSRQQLQTYLCSADVNIAIGAEITERDGHIQTISSPSDRAWSSTAILSTIFENEPDVLRTLEMPWTRENPFERNESHLDPDDDSMDVDERRQRSHPLDQLHELVVEEFARLLDELVLRVGGPAIHVADGSVYAPEWRKKPFGNWTPEDCLNFLNSKQTVKQSRPEAGVFLRLPHSRLQPARRGQDWPREAWDQVITYLTRLSIVWGDDEIGKRVEELEAAVERTFEMKMRPTGS